MTDTTPSVVKPRRRGRNPFQLPPQIPPSIAKHYQEVSKYSLTIPIELYQRDESDGKIAKEIAAHLDWIAFGTLTVIRRSDGTLHVVDGGTRLSAARLREDLNELPCMVYENVSDEEAAKTFLRINMNRRRLRTEQQQKSEFYAGEELAKQAEDAWNYFASNSVGFESLHALRSNLKSCPQATHTIVHMSPRFAAGRPLSRRVFNGLVWLEDQLRKHELTLDKRHIVRKLQNNMTGLDDYIAGGINKGNAGDKRTCGMQIAKKLKLKVPRDKPEPA